MVDEMPNDEKSPERNRNEERKDAAPQPAAEPQPEPTAKADAVESSEAPAEAAAAEPAPAQSVAEEEEPDLVRAAYEHPLAIRITHWVNAISLFVMAASGLRIFRAFPSFGAKIPEKILLDIPKSLTLGGWLGGALQWHFTFMWIFAVSGLVYVAYQVGSGHYRTMLFTPRDIAGVWPMARHYFFFGPKPPAAGQYNPLQKLAYTSTVGFGALSLLTGIVLFKPAQFSWLAFLFGGFHLTRLWHFAALCGFLAFIPGHLIMVVLHGWANFYSMLSGWKREPEYQE
ncbi:MAG: cytochrome b/b6 domain-containing protein [Acidobacteriia bacterium]|nr:cytochrome b/b6 domain-containing protein [Terriglobia bacterium]